MNNQQMMNFLRTYLQHPIHRVPMSNAFARWLTMTNQTPTIGGMNITQLRQTLLDDLYKDWLTYRDRNIEQTT